MAFFTLVLIAVIILAIIGLGWNTFVVAVLDGFDRTLDVGIPILKNLTQEAQAQQQMQQHQQNFSLLAQTDPQFQECADPEDESTCSSTMFIYYEGPNLLVFNSLRGDDTWVMMEMAIQAGYQIDEFMPPNDTDVLQSYTVIMSKK